MHIMARQLRNISKNFRKLPPLNFTLLEMEMDLAMEASNLLAFCYAAVYLFRFAVTRSYYNFLLAAGWLVVGKEQKAD